MDPRGIVILAVCVVIAASILSAPIGEVQETETYFTSEPYTYQQSLVRVNQVRNFPWINEVTQAQYIVKNTDAQKGPFVLNFRFDNGAETETKTKTVDILAGEEKAVTIDSSLKGESKVTLNVIPPKKSIPQQRTVTKKLTGWDYIWRFIPFLR